LGLPGQLFVATQRELFAQYSFGGKDLQQQFPPQLLFYLKFHSLIRLLGISAKNRDGD
jgi:hypothetical protein